MVSVILIGLYVPVLAVIAQSVIVLVLTSPSQFQSLMPASPHSKRAKRPAQGGFALVIALSLMAFVLLLLLSITTLVQVETQGSQIQLQQMEAEQSALLGLQIALGELQKTAGPDQRITATAGINAANTAQPHLLGVWESFKQANEINTPINYTTQKSGDFVQWLSSTAAITDKTNQTYPTATPTNPVILVGDGTLPTPDASDPATQYVQASTVDVLGANGNRVGGYAWHVFDESQKANLTLKNPVTATNAERVSALGVAGAPNFTALANASDGDALYSPLENLSAGEQEKAVSISAAALLGNATFNPQAANAFHVLTTDSKSLLVDVANGGFQKDLSLLFEDPTLPAEYADRHIYSESDTPVADAPSRFGGGGNSAFAEPIPSPDPKWPLLHSHYKLYRSVSTGSNYSVQASGNARFLQGSGYDTITNPVKDPNPDFLEQQQLLPVISNAQFIFSITPQRVVRNGVTTLFVQFVIDTVVTLWNPYNVNLEFSDMEIEFYRFPLQVEFFRNGTLMTTEPAHIANMFNAGNLGSGEVWGAQNTIPYRARIQGASPGDTMTLKPGEYKVFSPVNGATHHQNQHYLRGMTLREGWNPHAGGVSARLILKDDNNANLGINRNGVGTTAFIVAEADDVYSVRVSASKVNSSINSSSFLETNDQEIAAYLKVFQGDGGSLSNTSGLGNVKRQLDQSRTQIGAIELDLSGAAMANQLPTYGPNEMSQLTIPADITTIDGNILLGKVPFLIASLRLKTEQDSNDLSGNPNASQWLHNGITNSYFSTGITDSSGNPVDQNEHEKTHQYEMTWEPMTSWSNIPTVELDDQNRGYGGAGVTSATGVNYAPYHQIPLVPATSMAQFSHAPLNVGGQAPLTTQIAGNSFASPLIPLASKSNSGSLGTHLDHSYMANTTLFDGYFLSTATAQTQAIYGSSRSLTTVIDEFFDPTQSLPLPNSNFEPATSIAPTITATDYDTFAQHLYNQGAFNVNSTSEDAWALFLASGTNEALPILDMLTASTTLANAAISSDSAVSRFAPLIGDEEDATSDGQERWEGHRRLTPDQIMTLAQYVVAEVKARGPFQSVAEFVNRQLVSGTATGNSGALQTAIENSTLNTDFGRPAPKNNSELTGTGTGNTSDGAATQITQADLLNRLAPSLTVRGDTFRIRAYGEVTDFGGQTTKAWCEAVVQRQHDFVDAEQEPITIDAALSITNRAFGRRFNIVSFRWLSADEV